MASIRRLGPFLYAAFQIFIGLAQLIVHLRDLLFGALAADLGVDARQRDGEVDRLGDIIVGAKFERIDDIGAFGFGRHHDDGQRRRGSLAANSLEGLDSVDTRHHDVEKDQIEGVLFDQFDGGEADFGLHDVEATALKTPRQDRPIVADIVDDKNTGPRIAILVDGV